MAIKIRFSEKFQMWIATFFGAGKLPKAPGTWGSLAALILLLVPKNFQIDVILASIIVFTLLSINIINRIEEKFGKDPGFVVIDEVIAMWILMLSPYFQNLLSGAICFFAFRMFDIFKPFPINIINKKKGSIFVLLDDIAAAMYTLILLIMLDKFVI